MQRVLILVILTSALVTVTTLVAAAAAAFFWGGTVGITGNDRASSGLMAAIYAPFALLALILPLLSAPMARLALRLGGSASGTAPFVLPPALAWVAVFAGAEGFTALARAAAGEPPFSHFVVRPRAARRLRRSRRLPPEEIAGSCSRHFDRCAVAPCNGR